MGLQSESLLLGLNVTIQATHEAAPLRSQSFQLGRKLNDSIPPSEQERRLEAAMLKRWNRPDMWPIPGGWHRLVACQVPLFSEQKKNWGYIDLMGIDQQGCPVIVE
ncbi:MAG: hypothetical protein ACKVT0_12975, partial [Planctomycetaceae bacterium]